MFWLIDRANELVDKQTLMEWYCKNVLESLDDGVVKKHLYKLLVAKPEEMLIVRKNFINSLLEDGQPTIETKEALEKKEKDFIKFLSNLKELTYIERDLERIKKGLEPLKQKNEKELEKAKSEYILFNQNEKLNPLYKNFNYKGFVFDYDSLFNDGKNKKLVYDFAKYLKVNSCVYCGRQYTNTVIDENKNVCRPDFDHFFPKSKYALLSLSFYNLVPSCLSCNQRIKGQKDFGEIENYIHPYIYKDNEKSKVELINKIFHFRSWLNTFEDKKIHVCIDKVDDSMKAYISLTSVKHMTDFFHIEAMYQNHNNFELKNFFDLKDRYPPEKIKQIITLLKGNMTEEELYRLILGPDIGLDYKEEQSRPLFKLKNDLAKELFPDGFLLLSKKS